MVYPYRANPGPSKLNWGIAGRRRAQRGGRVGPPPVHGQPSIKYILLKAAAGVLSKQMGRAKNGVRKRKQKVTKPWVDMGKESGAIQRGSGHLPTKRKKLNKLPIVYQYYQ